MYSSEQYISTIQILKLKIPKLVYNNNFISIVTSTEQPPSLGGFFLHVMANTAWKTQFESVFYYHPLIGNATERRLAFVPLLSGTLRFLPILSMLSTALSFVLQLQLLIVNAVQTSFPCHLLASLVTRSLSRLFSLLSGISRICSCMWEPIYW